MEPNKIRNDALVTAYQAMHANNTKETQDAVSRQMVRATFLLPVIPVKGKLPEDFPPKVLKNEKGQAFLPLFTDPAQARAGMKGLADTLLPIDISDAYGYLVDHKELQGLLVNAFAKPNLICPRPMVEALAKLWSRIKTAELNGEDPEPVSYTHLLVNRRRPFLSYFSSAMVFYLSFCSSAASKLLSRTFTVPRLVISSILIWV